jgi:heme/copper-type cytochrome/quinol oxidase subunit 3
MIWIIPNIFCYLMFAGVSTFTAVYADELREINRLSLWVIATIILLAVSVLRELPDQEMDKGRGNVIWSIIPTHLRRIN